MLKNTFYIKTLCYIKYLEVFYRTFASFDIKSCYKLRQTLVHNLKTQKS